MVIRSHIFKRVTIVGVGLIGGSIGLAIKERQLAQEVIGLSHRDSSLVEGIKRKAIDEGFSDVAKAIRNSDLVILAAPVDSIIKLLTTINPHLKRGCILTDVGSSKSEIVEAAQKVLSNPNFFVGSHPIAGSEKKGIHYSRADLFDNAYCIMTPTSHTSQMVQEKLKFFWTKIGAKVKFLSAEEHDRILAYISHLPHLLAYGLIELIPKEYFEFASQGLKDMVRIAGSSPKIWGDICLTNSKNINKSLDEYVHQLAQMRKLIISRDEKNLMQYFAQAKEKHDGFA